jgi:gliding motility-associated-like protein
VTGVEPHGTWTISNTVPHCLVVTADTILGTDMLCLVACDSVGIIYVCDTSIVLVTVIDSLPVAVDECVETDKNTAIPVAVLVNDRDPDFDRITLNAIVQLPKYGTAVIDQRTESIIYTPNPNFCGDDTLYYEICDGISGCDTGMVCIHVKCKCELPQVITPNNDGYNDELVIPCIFNISNVKMMVWNRWGLIVYESDNYKNDWDGKYNGEFLPAGTYWYAVDFKDPETGEQLKEANYLMIIK